MNFRGEDESPERNKLKVLHPREDFKTFVEEDGAKEEGHLRNIKICLKTLSEGFRDYSKYL